MRGLCFRVRERGKVLPSFISRKQCYRLTPTTWEPFGPCLSHHITTTEEILKNTTHIHKHTSQAALSKHTRTQRKNMTKAKKAERNPKNCTQVHEYRIEEWKLVANPEKAVSYCIAAVGNQCGSVRNNRDFLSLSMIITQILWYCPLWSLRIIQSHHRAQGVHWSNIQSVKSPCCHVAIVHKWASS